MFKMDPDDFSGETWRYNDCKRIARVSFDHNIYITLDEAHKIWDEYSDRVCAGWIFLPDSNDDLWDCISTLMED